MKIAITSKSFSKNAILVNQIKEKYPNAELVLQTRPTGLSQEELVVFLQGCEKAIIALEEITEEVLAHCPELKHISKFGVGLNNIDMAACEKHGVTVGWTGGVNKLSVAEMTLGFMLGLSRNLFTSSYEMKQGEWNKNGGFQLSNKTVGIIGVGHIGKEVIRLLKPFKCKVLVNDILDQTEDYLKMGVTPVSKEHIFKESNIISIHTPLTNKTRGLINIKNLENCKLSPFIINTARGGLINEDEIIPALDAGLIKGVALDVYVSEPLDIEAIYKDKRIITTPHIGGNAYEAVMAMGLSAINNLEEDYAQS